MQAECNWFSQRKLTLLSFMHRERKRKGVEGVGRKKEREREKERGRESVVHGELSMVLICFRSVLQGLCYIPAASWGHPAPQRHCEGLGLRPNNGETLQQIIMCACGWEFVDRIKPPFGSIFKQEHRIRRLSPHLGSRALRLTLPQSWKPF